MRARVEPLKDRILASRVDAKTITDGGIFVPEVARQRPQEAIVVGVGKACTTGVRVGDKILVGKYVGSEVSINDELFLILREDEVLGIIREEEDGDEA